MADKTDDIRQAIKKGRLDVAETRSAITEKLAILEDRVQETVETVKHTFDLHYQVKQRPWVMFGGSLVVGYMLGGRSGVSSKTADPSSSGPSHPQPHQGIMSEFKSDLASIKGAVFGVVISTLWAMAKQVLLPPQQIDGGITKPGVQPIDSPEITNRVVTSKTNGRTEV